MIMKDMENKDIDTCKLLYNTERVRLYIPEYGENRGGGFGSTGLK